MKENLFESTVVNSWIHGILPEGCRLCTQGMKMVYFMGGDCSRPAHCSWYCPLSPNRKRSQAYFIDEIPIEKYTDLDETLKLLIYEAKAINAQGMSITGGDPLSTPAKVDWACDIIRAMKIEFGDNFHIHLYTSGNEFNIITADKLSEAKLDAIRFHPDEKDFSKIHLAIGRNYTVGGEVPVIPTEENHAYLLKLGDYLENIGADYLNLNEFEMCEPNQEILLKKGFELEHGSIASVKGSREYAERFIKEFQPNSGFSIHFCSAASKDGVQIRERYLRRAENIQFPYEMIGEDGCLIFLRIEGSAQEISRLYNELYEDSGMPSRMLGVNLPKGTLDLPEFLQEDENFMEMLSEFKVKAGIFEILPFREKNLAEIREYTPLQDKLPKSLRKSLDT